MIGEKTNDRRPPELSTRDNVARAIYTEVKEGRGSPHGGVFLDISYQDSERVKKKLPSMYHQFKELADVDITAGPMEVGPTMHYIMGGIRVDADTAGTRVPGLFAAGEVAGGMHGSNRLGGNSLSDLIVFGQRAGAGAAEYAKKLGAQPKINDSDVNSAVDELEAPFKRANGLNPYDVQTKMHEIMSKYVGIFREEGDLKQGITELEALQSDVDSVKATGTKLFNPGWHLCLNLKTMQIASLSIAKAALLRKESRGAHSRLDFPNTEASFGKFNYSTSLDGGKMTIKELPLSEMPEDLKQLFAKKEPAHA